MKSFNQLPVQLHYKMKIQAYRYYCTGYIYIYSVQVKTDFKRHLKIALNLSICCLPVLQKCILLIAEQMDTYIIIQLHQLLFTSEKKSEYALM